MINALVVFNNGCLEGIFDDELYYRDGKVYLESDIWFSSDVKVEVYESENIFFVRLVDEYNSCLLYTSNQSGGVPCTFMTLSPGLDLWGTPLKSP